MIQSFKKAIKKETGNALSLFGNIINSGIYLVSSVVLLLSFAYINQAQKVFSRNFLLCLFFGFQAATNVFWTLFTGIINYPFVRIAHEDDKYFLYPRNVLTSIVLDNITFFDIPLFIINYGLFLFFGVSEHLNTVFLLVPFSGTLVLASCFIFLAALIFKTRVFQNAADFIFMLMEMAEYPAAIYPLPIKIILILIPLSLVCYWQLYFLLQVKLLLFALMLLIAVLLFFLSACFFTWLSKRRDEVFE